jgi:cholesterol transport system auxiliary component
MRIPPTSIASPREGRPATRLALRGAGLILLAGLAAACSSGSAPTTFDLSAASGRVRGSVPGQVVVAEPAAVQALAGDRILTKDAAGTISVISGAQWADQLPRLVQARLIHTFENTSSIRAVNRPSTGVAADLNLVSEIRAFQIVTPTGEAFVEISAKLVSDREGRVVAGRIFRARVPAGRIDGPSAARALDRALAVVMIEIVRWVGGGGSRVS